PALLAHVVVSKFCDHLPLYRQADIYARSGVEIDRSVMAGWIGRLAGLLEPLSERIERHVRAGLALHADDTPVPVLDPGKGKTKSGRLWTVVRDERPFGATTPPAAFYRYSPDRKATGAKLVEGFAWRTPKPRSISRALIARRLHSLIWTMRRMRSAAASAPVAIATSSTT